MIEGDFKLAKFRIIDLPPGGKSNKNVVRVVKVRDLKPSKNPEGGAQRLPNTRPNDLVAGRLWLVVENVSQPTITVFPPKGKNTGAAAVVFPGGGYWLIAMDPEGTEVCDWLTFCICLQRLWPSERTSIGHGARPNRQLFQSGRRLPDICLP